MCSLPCFYFYRRAAGLGTTPSTAGTSGLSKQTSASTMQQTAAPKFSSVQRAQPAPHCNTHYAKCKEMSRLCSRGCPLRGMHLIRKLRPDVTPDVRWPCSVSCNADSLTSVMGFREKIRRCATSRLRGVIRISPRDCASSAPVMLAV